MSPRQEHALTGDDSRCVCGSELVTTKYRGRLLTRCKRSKRLLREALPHHDTRTTPVGTEAWGGSQGIEADAVIARRTSG